MPYKDKEKQRAYQREWFEKRRKAYFEDKQCYACGSKENLELDHVDSSSKVSHNVWSWSEEKRIAELAKCDALCYTCHKLKTLLFDTKLSPHGSIGGYTVGCRCELCREAVRLQSIRLRKKWGGRKAPTA